MSRGCQEGVKSCEEGVKSCEEGVKSCQEGVKSCQEGVMRVTVSRRCQELSRVCQDCVTKEHCVEGQQVPVGFNSMQLESHFKSSFGNVKAFNLKKLKLSLSPSPQWPQAALLLKDYGRQVP